MDIDQPVAALTARRRESGLTQREVAVRVGVAQSLVSYWERGIAVPSSSNLRRWAEVLAVVVEP